MLHGVRGESAQIVEAEEMGLTFEPENAMQLGDLLIKLAGEPEFTFWLGKNGLSAAGKYDRQNLATGMLSVVENYVAQRK